MHAMKNWDKKVLVNGTERSENVDRREVTNSETSGFDIVVRS